MASNSVKFLRGEIKRLESLVAKLTGSNEALSLQLKQREDDMAKRRIEVATLHQACAEYKRTRRLSAATPLIATPNAIKQAVSTIDAVCLRCQKSKDTFGELKAAIDAFAEKLRTAFAAKEAQFAEKLSTALSEKDSEIAKLAAALAEKERKEEERRQRVDRQKAESRQEYEDTMRRMAEMHAQQQRTSEQKRRDMDERKHQHERESARELAEIRERKLQHEREAAQELRDIEERHLQRVQAIQQRAVVQSRRRRGVADAG